MTGYTIVEEYGYKFPFWTDDYDHGCRVAHFVRKLGQVVVMLVYSETGRATSEVHSPDMQRDIFALVDAKALVKEFAA